MVCKESLKYSPRRRNPTSQRPRRERRVVPSSRSSAHRRPRSEPRLNHLVLRPRLTARQHAVRRVLLPWYPVATGTMRAQCNIFVWPQTVAAVNSLFICSPLRPLLPRTARGHLNHIASLSQFRSVRLKYHFYGEKTRTTKSCSCTPGHQAATTLVLMYSVSIVLLFIFGRVFFVFCFFGLFFSYFSAARRSLTAKIHAEEN
jgi:hypothetical protein